MPKQKVKIKTKTSLLTKLIALIFVLAAVATLGSFVLLLAGRVWYSAH